MYFFAVLFVLISIIMTPAFYFYSQSGVMVSATGAFKWATTYILGNMGFSRSICVSTLINIKTPKTISCDVGLISQLYSVGIIP